VLGRQQLFTENTLTPILPLLHNRDLNTLFKVLRLWVLVLAANIAGTAAIAAVLAHASIFEPAAQAAFAQISQSTVAGSFAATALRAIFAGWLIALMVWLLPAAVEARPTIVILITYVVALGNFMHIIAGSEDAFYLVETSYG
jgi:formate-nitrite transporter family protein